MSFINLQSSDGEVFRVDVDVATCSGTIKTMIEDCGLEENEDFIVPLPNVRAEIMRKVLEWAHHHKDDAPPKEYDDEDKAKRCNDIDPWDLDFLKVDQPTLYDIILAANYLDVKGLLELTCKTVANMIRGRTAQEIRATFNIKNDFTPEEIKQIRLENEWCVEK